MPFPVPTLRELRSLNRDSLSAFLKGADASVPNRALRVLSDQNAGAAHLILKFIAWIARNVLPDRAEKEWLDRWANILFGGKKAASFASGALAVTGTTGTLLSAGSPFATSDGVQVQTTDDVYLSADVTTPVPVESLVAGAIGNREPGAPLTLTVAVAGISAQAKVISLTGGADEEETEDLRTRVLLRIRRPPMGGDADDYVQWALSRPGVTRAWPAPNEMGVGTVTVRIMCDDLRALQNGFPATADLEDVADYLDTVRPVTVKELYVEAPKPEPLVVRIANLSNDTPSMRLAIAASIAAMLHERAEPGQTIYAAWISAAISDVVGDGSFDLIMQDAVMPTKGHMAVLNPGGIIYS